MGSDLREFCLRWNNHHNTLISVLDSLLERERLVDVTLAAEGQFINVHRIVLFACSQYFEELLSQLPDKQAVVFLKDVKFSDLKALVDYMYKGEVNVSQDRLEVFLQTAEALKIKGLVDKQQHKKFTASLPESFLASNSKARMNGPKISQLLPEQFPASIDALNSRQSPVETVSSPPPAIQMNDATLSEEQEDEELEEQVEGDVMVAEMEPDDHFVSVYAKRDLNMDSEFGDDHFEATENWSSQDADDDYWNSSHEGTNATSATNVTLANNSSGGSESWTPNPDTNDSAGTSKPKRAKRKSIQLSSTAPPTGRGSSRRRVRSKFEIEYENDDYTLKLEDAATVNDAGVTTCSCGRSYSKRKNYIRHIKFECGKEPRFACEYKDCTSRFKRKDNLKGHMDRVHLACTS